MHTLLSIFNTRFSPITANPINPISAAMVEDEERSSREGVEQFGFVLCGETARDVTKSVRHPHSLVYCGYYVYFNTSHLILSLCFRLHYRPNILITTYVTSPNLSVPHRFHCYYCGNVNRSVPIKTKKRTIVH